jgi:hypothetical protein
VSVQVSLRAFYFSFLVVREEKENKKKYKRREKWVG